MTAPVVILTEAAHAKATQFMADAPEGACLRVGVRGGGCSGFQYVLAVDMRGDRDLAWQQDALTVVCDEESAALLAGTTLDYKETIAESGFVYENPNATAACGCGSSFRVDDQDGCDADAVTDEDIYGI